MAGGFLMLAANGAGALSLDTAWARRRAMIPAAPIAAS
jgi:uncharacterized membrane protein YphA (DoxX/SURF4 family)